MEYVKDLNQEVEKAMKGIDRKAVQKMLLTREERKKWNKILHRPDECKHWHMGICLYKAMHEPLQGQEWSTCSCDGVCEDFVLRRGKKVEKNTR